MPEVSDFARQRVLELWKAYKAAGGTQVTLAAKAGVGQGQISDWLKGIRVPNIDGLAALAKGFEVPLTSLLPPEETYTSPSQARLAELIMKLDERQATQYVRMLEAELGLEDREDRSKKRG